MHGQVQELPLSCPGTSLQIEVLSRVLLRIVLQAKNVSTLSNAHSISERICCIQVYLCSTLLEASCPSPNRDFRISVYRK